jgi:hypothetical protein
MKVFNKALWAMDAHVFVMQSLLESGVIHQRCWWSLTRSE